MSDPTRGMVAGQAIVSNAQTKEFDEGYERTFGNRKPQRGRWIVDKSTGELVEIGADWSDAPTRTMADEESVYGKARTTDGTPIDSRKKHREYLKQNGLTMASDFPETYQKREAQLREWKQDREIREQVSRDVHKIFGG